MLDVETVVCGHGPMGRGRPAVESLIGYLESLHREVGALRAAGRTAAETVDAVRLADLVPSFARASGPPAGLPAVAGELLGHLHRLNVLATYRTLESAGESGS